MYDKLVAKVNNIDTSGLVLKTKYCTDKSDLELKISDADTKKILILVDLLILVYSSDTSILLTLMI